MRIPMLAAVAAVALSGCSVNPKPFIGPSGNDAYSMTCSGMGRGWSDCYTKAAELCPDGYKVVSQQSGTKVVPTAIGPIGSPNQSLAVECK